MLEATAKLARSAPAYPCAPSGTNAQSIKGAPNE
ncbi:hypothetical protein B0G84_3661 [Paraburkholderia sp. BL8N3]|nr:hypothetical protein B0G84_3661 [Paraburkholderia sp. BL8N3]